MDRGRGAYLSQSRPASSREKPRLENITLFSCPTRSDDNNNPSFARESGRRKGFLNRSCVVSCSSRFYDFSTINFYPRIFFPPLPINRSNHYPTTLHFVTFITNYNAPRERFRKRGNWPVIYSLTNQRRIYRGSWASWRLIKKILDRCVYLRLSYEVRAIIIWTGSNCYRACLSLSLCIRVLSSVHPMHNAYSPPSACTLIDIPTIGRFAYGDIIVVSPNRLSPSLPPFPRSTTIQFPV